MNARLSTLIDFLFLRDSHAATTVIATAPIVATWSLLLFTRDTLPQNSMTWDLMHAMAGGWYLREGLSAHGDFITQMGYLSFFPIHLGMFVTGPSVFAFHAVTAMALALVYPLCILACHRRVATFQSWIVTLALSAIVLLPTNIGEGTGRYVVCDVLQPDRMEPDLHRLHSSLSENRRNERVSARSSCRPSSCAFSFFFI